MVCDSNGVLGGSLKIGLERQIQQILIVLPPTIESVLLPSFLHRVGMERSGSLRQKSSFASPCWDVRKA